MGRRIDVTITYLEQRARPLLATAARPPFKVAILRAERPPVHFYRYLYGLVGEPYKWVSRKKLTDAELETILHDPSVYLYVLYVGGVPGGMAEVDARGADFVEIKFFGLAPDFIGVGLGRYFLTNVIELAWSLSPKAVRLETCTLDHPAALPLYQKLGFTVFDQRRGQVELLED
ncbi:MAG: GNAT family N-acetyltransferase [Pseudomonadota bacterium]|nr:GNAT family N-acetyltransferase [Pseudomonadota bacterium]